MEAQKRSNGSYRLTDTPESKQWRRDVTLAIRREVGSGRAGYVLDRAVTVRLTFYTPYAPTHPWAGDLDKLERNVLDAMTGAAISDDRYVVKMDSVKVAAAGTVHGPGVLIEVWEVPE
jgi:Holliday junction resolvase RusA-like endonuclease